jgi:hypothetical protein
MDSFVSVSAEFKEQTVDRRSVFVLHVHTEKPTHDEIL